MVYKSKSNNICKDFNWHDAVEERNSLLVMTATIEAK